MLACTWLSPSSAPTVRRAPPASPARSWPHSGVSRERAELFDRAPHLFTQSNSRLLIRSSTLNSRLFGSPSHPRPTLLSSNSRLLTPPARSSSPRSVHPEANSRLFASFRPPVLCFSVHPSWAVSSLLRIPVCLSPNPSSHSQPQTELCFSLPSPSLLKLRIPVCSAGGWPFLRPIGTQPFERWVTHDLNSRLLVLALLAIVQTFPHFPADVGIPVSLVAHSCSAPSTHAAHSPNSRSMLCDVLLGCPLLSAYCSRIVRIVECS